VLGIVLPITLSLAVDVAIEIIVLIVIIIVVDLNVATVPIAIAPVAAPSPPGGGTERNSGSPRKSRAWYVTRIRVGIIGICRRSRSVHHSRVVRRDVDNIGVCLLDLDHLVAAGNCLGLYHLLRAGF
jgi:hypothetical protein